jgi:hypothetical protein
LYELSQPLLCARKPPPVLSPIFSCKRQSKEQKRKSENFKNQLTLSIIAMEPDPQSPESSYLPQMPTYNALNPQFGVYVLDPEKELSYIEHFMRGDEPVIGDEDEVKWLTGKHEAVMNNQGVYETIRYLRGISSKLVTISNVDEKQFRRDLMDNCLNMEAFLFHNYRRFDLKPSKYEMLCTELMNYIEYALAKAKGKHMAEFVHPKHRSVSMDINQRQGSTEQKKTSPFSFLGF